MAERRGRPTKHRHPMKKTSIALPDEAITALKAAAKQSGFQHWSEQLRYEILKPRGLWRELTPMLPGPAAPNTHLIQKD